MRELSSRGSLLSPLYFLRSQQKPEASSRVFHSQGHQDVSDQMGRKVSAQGTTGRLHSTLRPTPLAATEQLPLSGVGITNLQMTGCGWELSSTSSL